jgi:ABC-type amino acid transport substrate-binding protein
LRIKKCALLIICLASPLIQCGKKEGPDAWASMKKNKMVRIATDAVNMPFEFGSGTGVQGLDVDIGTEIGKDLGYDVKWIKSPLERQLEILKNGEVEVVISAIPVTEDLKKDFALTTPYFDSHLTIARRQEKHEIKELANLANKKVGVQSKTMGDSFMSNQKVSANVSITRFPTIDDGLGALNRGEIDAVVGPEPILTYSIYKSFSNLITTGVRLQDQQYVVVVRKEEKELYSKVNATVLRMKKAGDLETLRRKWFQNVIEEAGKQRQDMEEKEALKQAAKSVNFEIVKAGGNFNMDRLDGFQLVLVGEGRQYTSTPILTNGPRGNCEFNEAIPPGEYKLNMSIFKMTTTVNVPKIASRSLTMVMNITASGLTITAR